MATPLLDTAHPGATYADPIDAARFGEYRRPPRSAPRFTERIVTPGDAGRYHLYGARFCPASHRLAVLRSLAGLDDAVSMSWVDGLRDGRGWAFRASTGADPVNGFTLLAQAYEATLPGYDGPVSVPVLWDRTTARIASNDAVRIGVDLLTAFGPSPLYPAGLGPEIERAGSWITSSIDAVVGCAVYRDASAVELRATLQRLDGHLAAHEHLVGDALTDADVRLWVGLVRYDAGPNAHGAIGPHLDAYPNLWRYARALYALPAFRDTTDFASFSAPFADVPAWD